jgi:predicted nucleic acid-binding protein
VTDRLVCDASAVVAALLDGGPAGTWAAGQLRGRVLVAPDLMPFEVANVLRRQELAGAVTADQAAQAHRDLLDLAVELWPYELLASGSWPRRQSLSIYDAAYVALAERTGADLITLDVRLAHAPNLPCAVLTPPE